MVANPGQFDGLGVNVTVNAQQANKDWDDFMRRVEASVGRFEAACNRMAQAAEQADKRVAASSQTAANTVAQNQAKQAQSKQRLADSEIRLSTASKDYQKALTQIQDQLTQAQPNTVRYNNLLTQQARVQNQVQAATEAAARATQVQQAQQQQQAQRAEQQRQRLATSEIQASVATKNYSQALSQISAELSRTQPNTARYNQLLAEQARVQQQATKAAQEGAMSLQSIRRAWFDVIAIAGMVAVAVGAVVAAFKQLEDAAEFRGMVKASSNMSRAYGVDMAKIMAAMDEATNSTITAQDKFRLFNEAMLAGGEAVASKLPQLLQIARAAAIASGADFETVFNKLLLGIARGSSRLIDDARIYLKMGDVVQAYADKMGIATDQVDQQTQQLLVLNAVLEQGAKVVAMVGEDAVKEADGFKQATKAVNEFWAVLKQAPEISDIFSLFAGVVSFKTVEMIEQLARFAGTVEVIKRIFTGGLGPNESQADVWRQGMEAARQRMLPAMGVTPAQKNQPELFLVPQGIQAGLGSDRLAALAKAEKDINDLIIKSGEKILDLQLDRDRQLEDAERDHQERVYDIVVDGIQKREDLAIDYSRKLEDADIDYRQAVEDAAREHDNRLIDIEQKYQDAIRKIQDEYTKNALEAVRDRDAIALVRAREQRDRELAEAGRTRDREAGSEERDYSERLENARRSLERKREDALRSYQRELDDQHRAELRALEDEGRSYERRRQQILTNFAQRLEDLRTQHAAEMAEINARNNAEVAAYAEKLRQMRMLAIQYGLIATETPNFNIPGFAGGGDFIVNRPTPILVGEGAYPEHVRITPLMGGARPVSPPATMNHVISGTIRQQVDATVRSMLKGVDGRIAGAVQKGIMAVMR